MIDICNYFIITFKVIPLKKENKLILCLNEGITKWQAQKYNIFSFQLNFLYEKVWEKRKFYEIRNVVNYDMNDNGDNHQKSNEIF